MQRTLIAIAVILRCGLSAAGPVPVELQHDGDKWQLLRAGQPYFIRGGGGMGSREMLANLGGNSVRTWGTDGADKILADAERLHLTVAVGIWLAHPPHGFDYSNASKVARQEAMVRREIEKLKDSPAVLLWGLGNEVESEGHEDSTAVYKAIDRAAVIAHEVDPHHPTMAVFAEITAAKVAHFNELCPHVDILGINSYGPATTLAQRYRKFGGTKPYILTEFGPPGAWESKRTSYGAPFELTSTAKAEKYREAYTKAVLAEPERCLGSYAFLWGLKQEGTATWFGTFLPDGAHLAAVDVLGELWSGKPAAKPCPVVRSLKWDGADPVQPGASLHANLDAVGGMKVRWILQAEQKHFDDHETPPQTFADSIVKSDEKSAEVLAPKTAGAYRLYAYIYDENGGAATANLPLRVTAGK